MGSLVRHRRLGPLLLVIALALVAIGCPTSETVDDEDARGDASVGGGDADRTSDAHNTPDTGPTDLGRPPDASRPDTAPPTDVDGRDTRPADTTDPEAGICGDGVLDEGEGCDDGNNRAGDGCGESCKREIDFVCQACGEDDRGCGGEGDLCIDGACGADCSELPCPTGMTCQRITNRRVIAHQCLPDRGCGTGVEICDNDADDDGDTHVDCDDRDCADHPACDVVGGPGSCDEPEVASLGRTTATPSEDIRSPSCLTSADVETVFAFRPIEATTYCLDTRGSEANDTVVSVRTTCDDADSEVLCVDDVAGHQVDYQAYGEWTARDTTRVFVIVDVYDGTGRESVQLSISEGACVPTPPPPIDVGTIGCLDSPADVARSGAVGDRFLATCRRDCDAESYLFGTDIYTDDSLICLAAIHAGVLTATGGRCVITIEPGQDRYAGSTRNGVESLDWEDGGDRSFSVQAP